MARESRLQSMLFNYQTTNKTDYRGAPLKPLTVTKYKPKPPPTRAQFPPLKDTQTLTKWKAEAIPFNVLHRIRPITQENPSRILESRIEKSRSGVSEHILKNRPRRIMTPQVSMDDIEDPRARELLVGDMYTSTVQHAQKSGKKIYERVQTPFPGRSAPANPIGLPRIQPPCVPPEWRRKTITWDGEQLRGFCDPTKEFWLSHQLSRCRPCEETKIVNANRRMQRQLRADIR